MTAAKLTSQQKAMLACLIAYSQRECWYRSRDNGERVTLASLYARGLAVRRAWRGAEGQASAAHEYQASPLVLDVWASVRDAVSTAEGGAV